MIHRKIELRTNNSDVYMMTYILKHPFDDPRKEPQKRPLIVICPGGGYRYCSEREAEPIALNFNAAGFHAVVVYYSTNEKYPASLIDLSNAVVKIREHAEEWHVASDKIIVCGFSAGGHLAGNLGVAWNCEPAIVRSDEFNKPNGMILSYAVITSGEKTNPASMQVLTGGEEDIMKKVSLEKNVTKDCPPAFIWHTYTDGVVPIENSVYMLNALVQKKIPTEFHIYPEGRHGLSLATDYVCDPDGCIPKASDWIAYAVDWIHLHFLH